MPVTRDDTLLTPELIERYTAAGYWSDETLVDAFRQNAEERPDETAYVDDRTSVTWDEVWRAGGEIASGLAHRGVGRGDVVAVQLPNRVEFVHVLVGVLRLGAVFCQYPPDYRAREVEFLLGFSEARAVVVVDRFRDFDHPAMVDGIRERLPHLGTTVVVPTPDASAPAASEAWIPLDDLRRDGDPEDPAPDRPAAADDVMRIAFTSGTTGEPKAVMHTANTTLFTLRHEIEERGLTADSTVLIFLPVGMNAGFFGVMEAALAGARAVLMERFQPAGVLERIERYGVCTFVAAPTAVTALLAQDALGSTDLSSLTVVQAGGSSSPVELLREANERLGCPVVDLYGMLETGMTSCTDPDEPYEDWAGTVGRPYPWLQLRILDEHDRDVPAGIEGEIVKTGPAITVGYYRNPAKNAESWTADGWFRSGDRGVLDEAGRLSVSGRSKDMIIHGGANVWPREIEEVLLRHPDVADAAAIGVPDDYFGENVCACVVLRPGATLDLDGLVASMADDVAKYKLPQQLEVFDAFPLGPTGKVLKRDLAQQVAARHPAPATPTAEAGR
jgi:acyl-CoA synthetase (AMP-forming)/AMP-acid ligase II